MIKDFDQQEYVPQDGSVIEEYQYAGTKPQYQSAADDITDLEAEPVKQKATSDATNVEGGMAEQKERKVSAPADRLKFLHAFQNKKIWIITAGAIVVIIGLNFMRHQQAENNTIAPVEKTPTAMSNVLAQQQRLAMRSEQAAQATQQLQQAYQSLEQQSQQNQAAMVQLQQQVASLQGAINQMAQNEQSLLTTVNSLSAKVAQVSTAPVTKKVVAEKAKPVVQQAPARHYILQAIDAGGDRAWIQDQYGNNMSVAIGEMIPGLNAMVANINAESGQIITNKGQVIRYKM